LPTNRLTPSGVASVAIRSLHHAAEILTDIREKEEVLQVFEKINKETGWRIGFIYEDLKKKWGWNEELSPEHFAQTHTAAIQQKKAQQEEQERQMREQAQAAQQQNMTLQQSYHPGGAQSNFGTPQQSLQQMGMQPSHSAQHTPQQPPSTQKSTPAHAAMKLPPAGIPNPMYAKADFSLPQHPYQNFYVAPNVGAFGDPQGGGMYYHF
jgi:hypothetical protein